MAKEKRILSYFIGWLILGFIIMFVGVNKIFASTYYMNYNYQQQYYDNYGSSVSEVGTTWMDSFNSYVSDNITTVAGSYGAGLSITSPIPLLSGHTYSMSVYFEEINNIALSSKNEISVASSLSAAANDYANNIPGTEMLYSKVSNNTVLQFVFKVDNNHTHLFFPWTTTYNTTQDYVLTQIIMEDLGASGVTENEINQSLNNQTSELNNSIQNSTNTITDKIDDMEQSIVDSNKQTQEVIKDQFNTCRKSNNLLSNDFIQVLDTTIKVDVENLKAGTYTFKYDGPLASQLTVRKIVNGNISDINYIYNSNQITFTLTEDLPTQIEIYVHTGISPDQIKNPMLNKGNTPLPYEPPEEEICTNKLDEQIETSKGILATIKELPNMFLDMLLGLFIPDDLSFINEFKEVISNKLGFIASIPIQIIDFALSLVNVAFEEITTISFPSVSIFGFNFWNAEEIDITIMLEKLKPFRYFTDFTCVILCCRTLYDMYHKFTGGGAN